MVNKWIEEHEDDFNYIHDFFGYSKDEVIGFILEEINKTDSFSDYVERYKQQTGNNAENKLEVIAYYEQLRQIADKVIFEFIKHRMDATLERMNRDPQAFFARWNSQEVFTWKKETL